jgi:hypothetical protein
MPTIAQTTAFDLERGETSLWIGVPRQGVVLRPSDALMIPFSILWGGFAVFWEVSVLRTSAPSFFALWGIPFVLVGLYIIIGRFFVDARRRAHTSYALTSERVIIRTRNSVKSLSVRTLSDVTLTERADGSGTITFGPNPFPSSMYAGTSWPGIAQPPAFEMIPDARRVYSQVRAAQSSTSRAG